jgi:hypothetical protein
VQKWLFMGLAKLRPDPEFGWATTPNGLRGCKSQSITQTPTYAGWLQKGLLGARSLWRVDFFRL